MVHILQTVSNLGTLAYLMRDKPLNTTRSIILFVLHSTPSVVYYNIISLSYKLNNFEERRRYKLRALYEPDIYIYVGIIHVDCES